MTRRRCRIHPGETGFTLVEIALVVVMIGIVASAALPSMIRARGAAGEASTIASLRLMHGAQVAFASSCAGGFYAPSVPQLVRRPTAGGPAFLESGFTADTTDRQGYRIRFSAGPRATNSPRTCTGLAPGQALQSFFVEAGPVLASAGLATRYFGVTTSGRIYQSRQRVRPIFVGEPPPPARLIQ